MFERFPWRSLGGRLPPKRRLLNVPIWQRRQQPFSTAGGTSPLATDVQQRELFTKLADHLSVLADEVERAIANRVVLEP